MRLFLIRHGETAWNTSGRYQGQEDVPLSATGRRQAQRLAESSIFDRLDHVYASDLKRAWETAQIATAAYPLDVMPEPRLRELNFGIWQGLTYDQIGQQHAKKLARWNEDRINRSPPGGESLSDMARRLDSLLQGLRETHDEGAIALFAHGGSIRVVLCLLLDHPLRRYWQFAVDNTAIGEIELQPRGPVVVRWNDTHHLNER